jgi:hypothetical protein
MWSYLIIFSGKRHLDMVPDRQDQSYWGTFIDNQEYNQRNLNTLKNECRLKL